MSSQMGPATIEPFVMTDYEDVYALWQNCAGIGLSSADSQAHIATYLEKNPGMSFVAKVGPAIVGAVLSGHDGRRGYIHHLAVGEAYRLQGIGRHLLEHSLDALRAQGIQKCHLFIFHENQSGIRFWQNNDWTLRQDIRVMSTYLKQGNKSE